MAAQTVTEGSAWTLPACGFTAPDGKQFKAWKIAGTEYPAGTAYAVKAATTAFAVWEEKTYTVTLRSPASGSASVSAASAAEGTEITVTATPASGYELQKITYTPEGGSAVDITAAKSFKMPASNVTVDVSFKEVIIWYTVTYDVQGHGQTLKSEQVRAGGKAADKTTAAEGFAFKGWYKDQACTTAYDFSKETVNADLTLYAKWVRTYKVSFNTLGHGSAPSVQYVEEGGHAQQPNSPEAEGYVFIGWFRDSYGTERFDFRNSAITRDTVLYADWNLKIIKGDGGTAHYGSTYEFTIIPVYEDVKDSVAVFIGKQGGEMREIKRGNAYTLRSGSTVVTLTSAYIKTLSAGRYNIEISTNQGSAYGTFRVSTSPKTGDESNPALWAGIGIASAVVVAGIAIYLAKKKK